MKTRTQEFYIVFVLLLKKIFIFKEVNIIKNIL